MKIPYEITHETARGGTITQRELDKIVARILDSACQMVRYHDVGLEMKDYNVKRNADLGREIKAIGAQTLLMFTEPGGSAIIQSFNGRGRKIDTDPGSRIGKRLVRYAEGLMSRRHAVSDDVEALRAELAEPANVSDELALAVRVLDHHNNPAYIHTEWLGSLSDRAHALTREQLTGYDYKAQNNGTRIAEHYDSSRAEAASDIIRLIDMTLGHGANLHGEGIWPYASSIHHRMTRGFSGMGAWGILGHFDTWPDGLVEVFQLPAPGSDWHEDTSVAAQLGTMLRGGKTTPPSTRCAFRVCVTLDELLLGRDELIDLVARRCVRKPEYLTDIEIEHVGSTTARSDYRPTCIGAEGELLVLLNVVADGEPLLQAMMDGTLVVPEDPGEARAQAELERMNEQGA